MATPVAKLLAIKAFYLGHAAAESASRNIALSMVASAIEQLAGQPDRDSVIRVAFYLLLRAEMLRHVGDPVPDRSRAKQICIQIDSPLFDYFMTVEQATYSKAGIERDRRELVPNGEFYHVKFHDRACEALEVDSCRLSEAELRFLHKVTIKDLLDKHRVTYAP